MTDVIAIVGPTASGKTALAIDIAARLGGEIVGTDSMQAYRGMDIGTATPTSAELGGIHHHMIDVYDIVTTVSVVDFRDRARRVIDDVRGRGVVPVVVGGSGLYVRAVLEEMDFPGTDPLTRARWENELQTRGPAELHAILAEQDPEAAAAIEVNNGRRIVRALEVIEVTGQPFAARLPEPIDRYPTRRIGLRIPRDVLDARIRSRVHAMWDAGFVEEVRGLLDVGLPAARTASAALGYRPILDFLLGDITEDEAVEQTIADTRKFARRQQRWFDKDTRITWFDYDDPAIAEKVCASFTST